MNRLKYIFLLLAFVSLNSCIVVRYEGGEEMEDVQETVVALSPKPEIPISDKLVRSDPGDLVAFLPEEWFFVDVRDIATSKIITMAVNPDYSLGLIFTELPKDMATASAYELEGLAGVGKVCFNLHQARTEGKVKMAGKFRIITIGHNTFCVFDMLEAEGSLFKSAVFVTPSFNYYEIALITMDIKGKPLPSEAEIDKIFNSVLTTVVY